MIHETRVATHGPQTGEESHGRVHVSQLFLAIPRQLGREGREENYSSCKTKIEQTKLRRQISFLHKLLLDKSSQK